MQHNETLKRVQQLNQEIVDKQNEIIGLSSELNKEVQELIAYFKTELISVTQAGRELGIARQTVYRMIDHGVLHTVYDGGTAGKILLRSEILLLKARGKLYSNGTSYYDPTCANKDD